eukprot:1794640-Amphidinium_carterae.1
MPVFGSYQMPLVPICVWFVCSTSMRTCQVLSAIEGPDDVFRQIFHVSRVSGTGYSIVEMTGGMGGLQCTLCELCVAARFPGRSCTVS